MSALNELPQNPLQSMLSNHLGDLEARIDCLKERYQGIWLETEATFPEFEKSYSLKQKLELESEATELLDRIANGPQDGAGDREKLKVAIKHSGDDIIRLCGAAGLYVDQTFTDGFDYATKKFMKQVKKFDPKLKPENIYQAMRNIWIMNSLQVLMDQNMDCSVPMFAYSMLYPYSDNINDDPDLSFEAKLAMNNNFKQWLEGKECPYQNETEQKIYKLVKMIAGQFDRDKFPGVFQSLLGIFNAQIKSLIQQKQHQADYSADILDISFEKGGISVLADGYLIQGVMDDHQEDFCFGYGAFLQFADDIQDVDDDLANGHQTIFSQHAGLGALDVLANRLFNFMKIVIDRHLSGQASQRLRNLILKNCFFMVQEAISRTKQFYSPDYIRAIEQHFPFTLPYFQRVKKRLKQMLLNGKDKWEV